MKKQSGFTLIELLLVLAIIGIISAIAIPALLSQRARARDKSAQENCVNFISDAIACYDKSSEAGYAPTNNTDLWALMSTDAAMGSTLKAAAPQVLTTKNPWAGTAGAPPAGYSPTVVLKDTLDATIRGLTPTLGQVQSGFLAPTAGAAGVAGVAGAVGTNVQLNGSYKDGAGNVQTVFIKLGAID